MVQFSDVALADLAVFEIAIRVKTRSQILFDRHHESIAHSVSQVRCHSQSPPGPCLKYRSREGSNAGTGRTQVQDRACGRGLSLRRASCMLYAASCYRELSTGSSVDSGD